MQSSFRRFYGAVIGNGHIPPPPTPVPDMLAQATIQSGINEYTNPLAYNPERPHMQMISANSTRLPHPLARYPPITGDTRTSDTQLAKDLMVTPSPPNYPSKPVDNSKPSYGGSWAPPPTIKTVNDPNSHLRGLLTTSNTTAFTPIATYPPTTFTQRQPLPVPSDEHNLNILQDIAKSMIIPQPEKPQDRYSGSMEERITKENDSHKDLMTTLNKDVHPEQAIAVDSSSKKYKKKHRNRHSEDQDDGNKKKDDMFTNDAKIKPTNRIDGKEKKIGKYPRKKDRQQSKSGKEIQPEVLTPLQQEPEIVITDDTSEITPGNAPISSSSRNKTREEDVTQLIFGIPDISSNVSEKDVSVKQNYKQGKCDVKNTTKKQQKRKRYSADDAAGSSVQVLSPSKIPKRDVSNNKKQQSLIQNMEQGTPIAPPNSSIIKPKIKKYPAVLDIQPNQKNSPGSQSVPKKLDNSTNDTVEANTPHSKDGKVIKLDDKRFAVEGAISNPKSRNAGKIVAQIIKIERINVHAKGELIPTNYRMELVAKEDVAKTPIWFRGEGIQCALSKNTTVFEVVRD